MKRLGVRDVAGRAGVAPVSTSTLCDYFDSSIYRALAEHAKREAYPEAVEQAHDDFAALQASEVPGPRPSHPVRASL
ncbi:hypothetical protein [Streptomyces sp. NPDC001292]|uniref:hypothetical protein n=1 Tax=Streptomyces sp. NPDC001292 TaxID=3364558 RepID=UPI0036C3A30C